MSTHTVDENVSVVRWEEQTLALDDTFGLLADSYRRAAIAQLIEHESGLTVDELVHNVISMTHPESTDVAHLRERLRYAFYHNHLPKLEDADVIEYDQSTEVVEPQPVVHAFEPLIEWADHR